jgi:cell division protein ZapA
VKIFGQYYNIIGEEDPERVKLLAEYVDAKMNEIAQQSRGISALKISILAALNISAEVFAVRERNLSIANKGEELVSLLSGAIEE